MRVHAYIIGGEFVRGAEAEGERSVSGRYKMRLEGKRLEEFAADGDILWDSGHFHGVIGRHIKLDGLFHLCHGGRGVKHHGAIGAGHLETLGAVGHESGVVVIVIGAVSNAAAGGLDVDHGH